MNKGFSKLCLSTLLFTTLHLSTARAEFWIKTVLNSENSSETRCRAIGDAANAAVEQILEDFREQKISHGQAQRGLEQQFSWIMGFAQATINSDCMETQSGLQLLNKLKRANFNMENVIHQVRNANAAKVTRQKEIENIVAQGCSLAVYHISNIVDEILRDLRSGDISKAQAQLSITNQIQSLPAETYDLSRPNKTLCEQTALISLNEKMIAAQLVEIIKPSR